MIPKMSWKSYVNDRMMWAAMEGTPPPSLLTLIWRLLDWHLRYITCLILGHRMVDDSYGGPNSGDFSERCERCGMSHHQVLY